MPFGKFSDQQGWAARSAWLGRWWLMVAFMALPVKGAFVPLPLTLGIVLMLPAITRFGSLRNKGLLLIPVVYYLLHVLGMGWTDNTAFGLFDLQVKLGLLMVPLVAAGLIGGGDRSLLYTAMIAFSVGLVLAILWSTYTSIICYREHGWIECFTQGYLSENVHPSYLAWYADWALFYWGMRMLERSGVPGKWRIPIAIFMFLLLVYVVMLVSKSGLIGLAFVLVVLTVQTVRKLPWHTTRWLMLVATLAIVVPGLLLSRVLWARADQVIIAVQNVARHDPSYVGDGGSTNERLVAWSCSMQSISVSPWGVGTGDIKDELLKCYAHKGAAFALERKLNSHSQILQSGVALGWPGLLMVSGLMLIPLVVGILRKDVLLAAFSFLFLINGAVESVLEVQAGVVFFILFFVVIASCCTRPITLRSAP